MQVSMLRAAVDAAYVAAKVQVGKIAEAVQSLQCSIARAWKERFLSLARTTDADSIMLVETDGLLEKVVEDTRDLPELIKRADTVVEGHFGRVRTAAEYLEDAVPLVREALNKILATVNGLRERVDAIIRSYVSDGRSASG